MKFWSRFNKTQLVRFGVALATFLAVSVVFIWSPDSLQYPAPLRILRLAEIVDALTIALLFYASIGLAIGRRIAWRVALFVIAFSAIWESIQSIKLVSPFSILLTATFILVLITRHFYPQQHQKSTFQPALERALLFTLITTALGCIVALIAAHFAHHRFLLLPSIIYSLDHMFVLSSVLEPLPHTPKIIDLSVRIGLFLLGAINYSIVAITMLKPLIDQFVLTRHASQRINELLDNFGTSSDDFFKIFPADKSYYFGQKVDGFVAYGVSGSVCTALADPIAKDIRDQKILLDEFMHYTDQHGWQTCFLAVPENSIQLYQKHKLTSIKLGSAAIVDTRECSKTTLQNKHFRYIQNKFSKQGYETAFLTPPHSPELLRQLRGISEQWLARDRRKERQFAMGYFDTNYLQKSSLFVVYNPHNQPEAFVSLPPTYSPNRISFDLLRYSDDAPRDISAFLFARLITYLAMTHYTEFNMSLAPLAGLEESRTIDERGLHLLYQYTNRWFAFKGLHAFKNKFKPSWEPQYALYQGNRLQILTFAVELNKLMKYTKHKESAVNKLKK